MCSVPRCPDTRAPLLGGETMSGELVRYRLDDHVATITLDRPRCMNALNRELYARPRAGLPDAHRDPEVRGVVLTGDGRAFCSGDDVRADHARRANARHRHRPRARARRRTDPRRRSPCSNATSPSSPPSTARRSAGAWTSRSSATSASPATARASASCSSSAAWSPTSAASGGCRRSSVRRRRPSCCFTGDVIDAQRSGAHRPGARASSRTTN